MAARSKDLNFEEPQLMLSSEAVRREGKAKHVLINLQGNVLVDVRPKAKKQLIECGSCERRFCERCSGINMCGECGLSFCNDCDGTNGLVDGECMKCLLGYNRFDMQKVIKMEEEAEDRRRREQLALGRDFTIKELDDRGELDEWEREHFGLPAKPGDERYNDYDERKRRGETTTSEDEFYGEDGEWW